MKILFVDTTSADLVVAVVEENSVRDFSVKNCGTKHSELLCLTVQKALERCNLSFADLDAYACAVGPGSFTGIRIGISTVKGFALAVPKPFLEVNCLEAIAYSDSCGRKMKAVLDAGNGYYFADCLGGVDPCLVQYDDSRAIGAGTGSGADRLDGSAELVRKKFIAGQFSNGLSAVYIRRSQAEER